jgi:myo-inositol-1(or 4)-monophosphatase
MGRGRHVQRRADYGQRSRRPRGRQGRGAALGAAAKVDFPPEGKIPSLAYRLALVANGALDAALASINSHDWDIAGADIVLAEAGARLCDAEGRPLRYNQPRIRHDPLVAAPLALLPSITAALREALAGLRHET